MTITREKVKKIEKIAKTFFEGASGCHDWGHVERVRNLAICIAKREKADGKIVEAAALLYDIGRKEEMESKGAICHAEKGAVMMTKTGKEFARERHLFMKQFFNRFWKEVEGKQ